MAHQAQNTLGDVAKAAGVSLATASRVLNGTASVGPALRDRVVRAAERLAYSPNAHAQALARSSSRTVGVICHDVGDPYFAGIARGVMRAASRHDLQVVLGSTFRAPDREVAYTAMVRGHRVRAMLIGSGFEDRERQKVLRRELDRYRATGGRVAVLSRHRGLRADAVLPENREGAADLARALLTLGHRRFAVLSGPTSLTTVVDRVGGFLEALAEAGVAVERQDIVEGPFTRDGGYEAAQRLIGRGLRATCVFASTDVMAAGALAAMREHGIDVPGDVSLAGFDDIPMVRDLTPPLTTVALPLEDLGERVLELTTLPERAGRTRTERVRGRVVLRESTAPFSEA
ncbi:LacI family transcriptional regulator [Amycolatopsis sp. WAC 04182]|uniref:LacI family DNA-binding transcriptional regulator n=1 Tax=Amycolatopsis sp. WAC 04182 TaxID=2203198 RepID=UPI000F7A5A24|nr:LacI family DNA-binding transcriptional regulator [Amycolatopsis sp. WAC 04182]RSN56222.1 LacI family transcriptional regulator [Amycolatopsis sp. WAC 04182]